MSRVLKVVSIILIAVGLTLVIYQDPQFRLIFNSGSSGTISSSISRFSSASTTSSISIAYSAVAIIESLIGVGLAGIGLVLVVFQMLSTHLSKRLSLEQNEEVK